jgi:hypothetical protein
MANPVNWTALQERVDYIVDGALGEPVLLIPWLGDSNIYTPIEQGPDPNRKMLDTVGMFVTPGSKLIGESGSATGAGGSTQLLEQEVWLSITMGNIGDVTDWVKYDRVYFKDRDRFYNVSYVEDSATLRPNIHLIREHDIMTGQGNPLGQIVPTQAQALYFDTLGKRFYRSVALTPPNFTVNDWVKM